MPYNPGFDVDLQFGQVAEQLVNNLLTGTEKIEVKRDRLCTLTGNVAIEYECNGEPSVIAVTKAEWFVIVLHGTKYDDHVAIMIETERLKSLARWCYRKGWRTRGGDNNAAKMVLIPVQMLVQGLP